MTSTVGVEHLRVLVAVKAYPALSTRYGEVVCVAGIRLADDDTPLGWVRLFPVKYRYLSDERRFKKYDIISLRAKPHSGDSRPESWRPDFDSIAVERQVPTAKKWAARRELVEPMMARSMCQIQRDQRETGLSLGVFRPRSIDAFTIDPDDDEWSDMQAHTAVQELVQDSLLDAGGTTYARQLLERIPYRFRVAYHCDDDACSGHKQSIIDWEIGQAFRRFRWKYGGEAQALEKIRQKWEGDVLGPQTDTAIFTGNMHLYPHVFLTLGFFWPKR